MLPEENAIPEDLEADGKIDFYFWAPYGVGEDGGDCEARGANC
jgi:hypothetical protein